MATSAPGTPATEPDTQAASEAPSATVTSTTDAQTPAPTELAQWLEVMEPIVLNPLVGAGVLLALMGVLALLVYRRNQRADVHRRASSQGDQALQAQPAHPVLMDPLLLPRGLQAEIMALDLELGPSEAPSPTLVSPLRPIPAPPSSADLSLSKLQWAQQLLAAGENELARVLLTSVAESLQSQLQQRGDATPGPHQ